MKAMVFPHWASLTIPLLLTASVLPSSGASGGLQFDGVSDYVTFGQAPGLGTTTFTIETWFKRTGDGATTSTGSGGITAAVPLVTKGRGEGDGSNLDMNWFLGLAGDKLAADFEDTATGLNHPVTGTLSVTLNVWHHAAVTYDGSTWRLYLDGVLDTTLAAGATPRFDSIQHAALASALTSTGAAAGYFAGVLDEVRVWNYPRSSAQIAGALYSTIPTEVGLVGRWALDETSGTEAADTSGNGIDGTLVDGPLWTEGSPLAPIPTVALVSPADQSVVPGPTVTFTCQASDELGLAGATLYVGPPVQSFTFSGPAQTVDTQISADSPNSNYGSDTSLNVDSTSPHAHGLICFPNVFGTGVGQVPPGSVIASATLRVNCHNFGALMKAYRLIQAWDENTASWNQCSSGTSWPNPGADGVESHAAQAYDADCTATGWRTVDLTAIVQAWSDGSDNYGIVLLDTGTDGVDFYTSESTTPPELIITLQPNLSPMGDRQVLSGTGASVSLTIPLQDSTDYVWNWLVENSSGQQAWAPASFRLTVDSQYPALPELLEPANGAGNVALSPNLSVQVSDLTPGDTLTVSFRGRAAQSDDPDFTIVVLPDTQNYSQSFPAIFTSQTQWVVDNKTARNIVFVAHEGDVVNTYSDLTQYQNANTSLSLLDGVVPYGLLPGNHDIPTANFNTYFSYSRYQNYTWYGGHYPADANDNNFQKFTVGSQKFLVLHLSFMPSSAVITWAQGVISTHHDHKVIIVTHAFVDASGEWTNGSGTSTQYIWDGLVQPYANVCMVLCGHEPTEITRIDQTTDGRMVPQLLADYQGRANGGNGWLRLMRFSPAQNKVFVQTYSPYLGQYETDANSEFSLDFPMNPIQEIATQTGVTSGATASAVWANLAIGTTYEWQAVVTDSTGRTTTGPVWSFTTTTTVNAPPTVSITSPAEGALISPAPANVTITAAANDPDGTIAQVEFFSSSTSLGTDTEAPYDLTANLETGSHTLTAVATDNHGAQTVSAPVNIAVGTPPAAPSGLTATALSSTEIELAWADNSDNETGFEIYQSLNGEAYTLIGTVDAGTAGTRTTTVTGLQPSTTYAYVVRAFNAFGGAESLPAGATTLEPPPAPNAPSGLTAAPWSDTEIQLTWTDNSADETGFRIERSPDGATWAVAGSVSANTTSVRDTGLTSGTVYYYRVLACNGPVCSAPSAMTAAAPFIYSHATAETLVTGTLAGSFANTDADDGVFEQLTEKLVGGKPSVRYSALEHKWTFTVSAGRSLVFYVQAHQTASSDGDQFRFAYSTDDVTYQDMLVVSDTTDPSGYQSFVLPAGWQGTLYVRAQDTDHTATKTALDTLSVDHMFIVTDASPVTTGPAAPVLQQATPGNQTVTLAWTASESATSYTVWRKSGDDPYAAVATDLTATTYADGGLVNGILYEYVVTAHNAFGASAYSNPLSATPLANQPPAAAPQSVTTAEDTAIAITLSGSDPENDPLTFRVTVEPAHGALSGTAPHLTYTPHADYSGPDSFTFVANDGQADSAEAAVSITVTPAATPPAAPANLVATPVSKSQIDLVWTDNSSDETGFKIERSTDNANFTEIATVGAGVTGYSSTGLLSNKLYYYRVRATNSSGDSTYSNTASARTLKR